VTTEQVTLIVAGIAAIASLANVFLTRRGALKAELRVARRKSLEPYVVELGESLHQTLACAKVLMMTSSKEASDRWRARGSTAKEKLKTLRPKLRYALPDVDEGLRVLSRIPDWADHLRSDPARAKRLLRNANLLRFGVDLAVRAVYVRGNEVSLVHSLWVSYFAWRCRNVFDDRPEELETDDA
jgi:hypothetical protein